MLIYPFGSRAALSVFIRNFLFYFILSFVFSCGGRLPRGGNVFTFIHTGSWRKNANWQDGRIPLVMSPADTVRVVAGVTCNADDFTSIVIPCSMYIDGTLNLTPTDSFFIATGGRLFIDSGAQITGNGYLGSAGTMTVLANANVNFQGTLFTTMPGYTTNNGVIQVTNLQEGNPLLNSQTGNIICQQLSVGDSIYNANVFGILRGGGGNGVFVNYFGAYTPQYSGNMFLYKLTNQPQSFNCVSSPCTATFTVHAQGGAIGWQWQWSVDGITWNPVPAAPPFSGWNSNVLTITAPSNPYLNAEYRCQLTGVGPGNVVNTRAVRMGFGAKK